MAIKLPYNDIAHYSLFKKLNFNIRGNWRKHLRAHDS